METFPSEANLDEESEESDQMSEELVSEEEDMEMDGVDADEAADSEDFDLNALDLSIVEDSLLLEADSEGHVSVLVAQFPSRPPSPSSDGPTLSSFEGM